MWCSLRVFVRVTPETKEGLFRIVDAQEAVPVPGSPVGRTWRPPNSIRPVTWRSRPLRRTPMPERIWTDPSTWRPSGWKPGASLYTPDRIHATRTHIGARRDHQNRLVKDQGYQFVQGAIATSPSMESVIGALVAEADR